MTTAEIRVVLNRYADAKNRRDVAGLLQECSSDCYYESVGLGARVTGHDALRPFYEALFATLPDYYGEFDGTVIEGDTAVVWGHFGGTLAGSFMGIPVESGRKLRIPVTFVCKFEDGKITTDTGYFDVATLCEQAGILVSALRPGSPAAHPFVAAFAELWRDPSEERVRAVVGDQMVGYWPGLPDPVVGGDQYAAHIAGLLELAPDLRLEVTGQAGDGDPLYISWRGRGTLNGEVVELSGVDRFRIEGGLAVENVVTYDTAPLLAAAAQAAA